MRTIPQIITAAGGTRIVSERCGLPHGVKKWRLVGIHDRYWPTLMEMVPDLTAEELMQANAAVRQGAAA